MGVGGPTATARLGSSTQSSGSHCVDCSTRTCTRRLSSHAVARVPPGFKGGATLPGWRRPKRHGGTG
eukprot:COSAG02_NODE_790_length_17186_cov_791.824603_11_plen_67_part_00